MSGGICVGGMSASGGNVNHKRCIVGCLRDAACRTSMHSSALHPWFPIAESKSATMPYSSASSTHHLRRHYHHPHQHASPWLSSIVDHRPGPFVDQHHVDDHDRDPCRRQRHDQTVAGGHALSSRGQNSELDGRLLTERSPGDHNERDFTGLMASKTHQQTAKHHGSASDDTQRNPNKTSANTPGKQQQKQQQQQGGVMRSVLFVCPMFVVFVCL